MPLGTTGIGYFYGIQFIGRILVERETVGISNFPSEYKGPTVTYITSRYLEIQSISQIKWSHVNFLKVMPTYTCCSHSRFSSDSIPLTLKSAFMEAVNYLVIFN